MIGLGADQLDDIPRQDACSNAPALPLGAVWRIEKPDRALGECQPHESHEAAYQLVEARPDPSALLRPAHAALHRAPAPGGAAVEPEAAVAQGRVAALEDHRIDPAPRHPAPHPSAAVALLAGSLARPALSARAPDRLHRALELRRFVRPPRGDAAGERKFRAARDQVQHRYPSVFRAALCLVFRLIRTLQFRESMHQKSRSILLCLSRRMRSALTTRSKVPSLRQREKQP